MLLLTYLISQFDESKQADSIVKSWGVVEFHYHGWDIKNFDTLPINDSIPVPDGKYKVIDDYGPLHVKGKWEYYRRDWRTMEFRPELGSYLKGYPPDLLDWGKYLIFYIKGAGKYEISLVYIHKSLCQVQTISPLELNEEWQEVRIRLDSGYIEYDIRQFNGESYESPWCFAGKDYVPISFSIIPFTDRFGTYKYEIELSPLYLVK